MLAGILLASSSLAGEQDPEPVTEQPWQEVVVSVSHIDRTARFFVGIGGYEAKWRGPLDSALAAAWGLPQEAGGEALLLGPAEYESGLIRLVRFDNAGERLPMRPGSRAWDTGCYFSMMVRMKDMPEIYRRAIDLGWWTETPIARISFRGSELRVVIYRGPDGVQVQGYGRVEPPLPDSIPAFETLTGPLRSRGCRRSAQPDTGTGLGDTKRNQPRAAGTLRGHRPVRCGNARRGHHSVLLDREITAVAAIQGFSSSRRASSRSPAIIPR